jgi:hypothetical protein
MRCPWESSLYHISSHLRSQDWRIVCLHVQRWAVDHLNICRLDFAHLGMQYLLMKFAFLLVCELYNIIQYLFMNYSKYINSTVQYLLMKYAIFVDEIYNIYLMTNYIYMKYSHSVYVYEVLMTFVNEIHNNIKEQEDACVCCKG